MLWGSHADRDYLTARAANGRDADCQLSAQVKGGLCLHARADRHGDAYAQSGGHQHLAICHPIPPDREQQQGVH
jgi:hypothetical protein